MSETTTIYIIRHGQTTWNVERGLQGHQDSPLTELGIRQADWLSDALEKEEIDVMYASSSARALQNSRDHSWSTRDYDYRKRRVERNKPGRLGRQAAIGSEGSDTRNNLIIFGMSQIGSSIPHSETFAEVSDRAITMLQRIIEAHSGKSIAIVTHTVVVKLIMAFYEQRLMKEIWHPPYIHPTCLSKIVITEKGPEIILHGDVGHYKEAPTID